MRSVDIKFSVDVNFLESTISLGFVDNVLSYDDLTDTAVRTFLEESAKEANEVVTLDMINKIVEAELLTNVEKPNSKGRIQDLCTSYHTILHRNVLG